MRSNQLIALGKVNKKAFEDRLIGQAVEVLMEEEIQRDGETWQIGHTREYVKSWTKNGRKSCKSVNKCRNRKSFANN